ncbi:MAG: choice-of-anchor D domain-containing protein [Betaproteobacteria bacterium]|nr:choice-of-anchor D domain-containing protein [Betaproteobacteria bacterium]
MAQMNGNLGPAIRRVLLSMVLLAAAALAWQAPTASAAPAAKATIFPQSVGFPDTQVAGASPMQEIAFRNTGTGPMHLSDIVSVGGNFVLQHDCPLGSGELAAGRFCTIKTRFAPQAAGAQAGIVQVIDAALAVTHEILVQGSGVAGGTKIAPSASIVSFPDTALYSTSGPMVVTFTNNEGVDIWPYFLDYQPSEGEFSPFPGYILIDGPSGFSKAGMPKLMQSCETFILDYVPMAPGDSCFAFIYFSPYNLGLRTGSLVLNWDYCGDGCGETSISIPLIGNAVATSDSDLSVSATMLDFGNVVVGSPAVRTLTVTSTGYGPLTLLGVRATSDAFEVKSDCPRSLKTGSSCTVVATCTPRQLGLVTSDLYIDHDAVPAFTNVQLKCTGASKPSPKIEVGTTGVSFGNLSLGSTSDTEDVIISSVGTAPLSITNISTALPFAVATSCPPSLAPGESCLAKVSFTPASAGRHRSSLEIGSNDPDNPSAAVRLEGTGCRLFSILTARRGLGLCGP